MALEVVSLPPILFADLVGQEVAGPDLPVRVGVGATHQLSLVLENLHPAVSLPQLFSLLSPNLHHSFDGSPFQFGERQVMPF